MLSISALIISIFLQKNSPNSLANDEVAHEEDCIVLTLLAERIYNTEKSFRVSSTALNELRMIRGPRNIKKSRELVTHSLKGILIASKLGF